MRHGLGPVQSDAGSSRIKNWPFLTFLGLVMSGILAATCLAPAAMGRKPDLVVTEAKKFGPAYAVKGKAVTMSFKDVTKNKGNATAAPSRTGMLLVPMHARAPSPAVKVVQRDVPKLRPGHSDSGAASHAVLTDSLPLGGYKIKVCADVNHRQRERNEGNNCKRTGTFYVVQENWRGSVNGVGAVGSASGAEKWHTLGAHFDLSKYVGGGKFLYSFTGTVEWTDSGVTTGGCDIDGHGEKTVNPSLGLAMDYLGGAFAAVVATNRFYTITFTPLPNAPFCDAITTAPGPSTREVLKTKERNLLFDQNELKGSSPGDTPLAIWRWDFN
jgi:hypothetical protein